MTIRTLVQRGIDELQFRFDAFPTLLYQPLPWLGLTTAKRGEGTEARWAAIESAIDDLAIDSALDVGCNVGYFCFSLAFKGISTLGIDLDDRFLRIAQRAARKLNVAGVAFCNLAINRDTVRLLPEVDLVLLLSVWHHWVRAYGLGAASELLTAVWAKSQRVLFFETGEAEMPPEFGLSMLKSSPRDWLADYLQAMCAHSTVEWLGAFKAFAPQGDESRKVVYRNLFKVTRAGDESIESSNALAGVTQRRVEVRGFGR
ncbi:MAG: methyltransferase [Chloroflexi bacterium]|nr:methyltransferase [Chloroflexota bacterium]